MTEWRLDAPHTVEVVPADAVEPAMAAVTAELTALENELFVLDAEAARVEQQVEDARHRTGDGDAAVPLLERVFLDQTAAAQAELAAALQGAVRDAEKRLASARSEADALLAGMPSPRPRADDARRALGVATNRPRMVPRSDGQDVPRRPPAETKAQRSNGSVDEAPLQSAPAPAPASSEPGPDGFADLTATIRSTPAARHPAPLAASDDDPVRFGQFWDAETPAPPGGGSTSGVLDAILPAVAVLIIVIVLLSWVG